MPISYHLSFRCHLICIGISLTSPPFFFYICFMLFLIPKNHLSSLQLQTAFHFLYIYFYIFLFSIIYYIIFNRLLKYHTDLPVFSFHIFLHTTNSPVVLAMYGYSVFLSTMYTPFIIISLFSYFVKYPVLAAAPDIFFLSEFPIPLFLFII